MLDKIRCGIMPSSRFDSCGRVFANLLLGPGSLLVQAMERLLLRNFVSFYGI